MQLWVNYAVIARGIMVSFLLGRFDAENGSIEHQLEEAQVGLCLSVYNNALKLISSEHWDAASSKQYLVLSLFTFVTKISPTQDL